MPQTDSRSRNTMCRAQSRGASTPRAAGAATVLMMLLLSVLLSTAGCHLDGQRAPGTVGSAEESAELASKGRCEEVPRQACRATGPSVGPVEEPRTAEASTTVEDELSGRQIESVAANEPTTLIRLREVEPSVEPVQAPSATLVLAVGTASDAEEATTEATTEGADEEADEKVVQSDDVRPAVTPTRSHEKQLAAEVVTEDVRSVYDSVVSALPVCSSLVSTSKSVSEEKRASKAEAASGRNVAVSLRETKPHLAQRDSNDTGPSTEPGLAVSMKISRELPDAPADAVPSVAVMVTAHLQEMETGPNAAATFDPIATLLPQGDDESSSPGKIARPDDRGVKSISTDIIPKDRKGGPPVDRSKLPPDIAREEFAQRYGPTLDGTCAGRGWTYCMYQWESSQLSHKPLYFEEINAERYGYSCRPIAQPAISAAHFFAAVPTLPYQLAAQPPRECIYTLGYYRPGSCVPNRFHWPELRPKGGLFQASVVTGLIFAIP